MLKIKDVCKTFHPGTPNEVRALQGISLTVDKRSFVVLLGTNGSGKSTLLNAVAGSFPLDGGQIILCGEDITGWAEHRRASLVGRVFQNPFLGTAPDMSIAENLALASRRGMFRGLGMALNAASYREFRKRVLSLNMNLEDRLDNVIGGLSGGQRQALTLLMATWLKPKLLLLDEHTAALDPKTASKVIQLTEEIIGRDHLTTLMVTHSMQQAVNLGDRIIMLHRGQVAYDFKGEDKKHLQVPDLLALFDDLRRQDQFDISIAELLAAGYI